MLNCPGSGRPWPLYPWLPEGEFVILVEGELDALCGITHGLPVVSVPLGVGTWRERWADALAGRRVAVCFDNDAERFARARVRDLRVAGIDAYRLRLPRSLGPKGDLSDFLLRGGDPNWLRRRMK